MAPQQDTPLRSDVIRCEFCGEDYSVTYRKCPFCDDMAGVPVSYPSPGPRRGGKRQVSSSRGNNASPQPVRIIGYALGLILIVAAIYIVFTVLSPLFTRDDPVEPDSSIQSSVDAPDTTSQSQPDVSVPDPEVSVPDPEVGTPTTEVITPVVKTSAIALNTTDFTLKASETYKLTATLIPANSDEAVTWTSSDTSVAVVAPDGSVTNVNTGSSQKVATITITSGTVSVQCTARCKPGSTGVVPSAPSTPTTPSTPPAPVTPTTPSAPSTTTPSTNVASGTIGIINSGNVNIRETAGTGTPLDSSTLGAEVTILETTSVNGADWYKIRYNIGGGKTRDGYIRSDFVDIKSN